MDREELLAEEAEQQEMQIACLNKDARQSGGPKGQSIHRDKNKASCRAAAA